MGWLTRRTVICDGCEDVVHTYVVFAERRRDLHGEKGKALAAAELRACGFQPIDGVERALCPKHVPQPASEH